MPFKIPESTFYILFPLFMAFFYILGLDQKIVNYIKKKLSDTNHHLSDLEGEAELDELNKSKPSIFLLLMNIQKRIWYYWNSILFYPTKFFLKLFGVSFTRELVTHGRNSAGFIKTANKSIFQNLFKELSAAQSIKYAMGEMASEVLENPIVLNGIIEANKKNNAITQIIGGPRIDPLTTEIFNLSNKGIVEIYRSKKYNKNHFLILTKTDGKVKIVNESIHDETIWDMKTSEPLLHLFVRNMYLFEGKNRYEKMLIDVFNRRKSDAILITNNPGLEPPQIYDPMSIFRNSVKSKFHNIFQLISICLDSPFAFLFNQ